MRITEMDTMFNYNWWATSRVLAAAEGISDADFARTDLVPVPHGSIRGTLVHMLDQERSARYRLSRNMAAESLDETTFGSLHELSNAMRSEATAMKDYLIGLEDEHMDGYFALDDGSRYPYWQLLLHVIQHSSHHRSEAAVLLTALNRFSDEVDFYHYLKETQT